MPSARFLILVLFLILNSAFAQVPGAPMVRFTEVYALKVNGDIAFVGDLVVSPQLYNDLKGMVADPAKLLHELFLVSSLDEIADAKGARDDIQREIKITATLLGAARNRGKDWLYRLVDAHRYELVKTTSEAVVLQSTDQLDSGVITAGTIRMEFPPGTKSIQFDARQGNLTFEMPVPIVPAQAAGTVQVKMNLKVRSEIMSCLGKAYGNPRFPNLWVAKTVFRNTGGAPVSDLKVRFRLRQYTDWSDWKETKVVLPTQTVVDAFYPVMDPKICSLSDKTPVLMEVVWSYRRPDGKTVADSDFRILNVLGPNAVVFSEPRGTNFRLTGIAQPGGIGDPGSGFAPTPTPGTTCPEPLACPSPEPTPGLPPRPTPAPLK